MKLVDILRGKQVLGFVIRDHGNCAFQLNDGYSFSFDCLGRFVGRGRTFVTTADHGHRFGLPAPYDAAAEIEQEIKGQTIERAVIREDTNDLTLHFASGMLEIICDSAGYEAYQLRGPSNLIVVARGGKEEPNQPAPAQRP